jgi:hypothetical protein
LARAVVVVVFIQLGLLLFGGLCAGKPMSPRDRIEAEGIYVVARLNQLSLALRPALQLAARGFTIK